MKVKKFFKISGIVIGSIISLFVILVILAINFPGESDDQQGDTAAYEKQMFGEVIQPTAKDVREVEDQRLGHKVPVDKATLLAERKEMIEKYFSAWNGRHIGLTILAKKYMHDPESFEHVRTRYEDHGNYLIVKMSYRGNNIFGGKVLNWVEAKVDLTGNVLKILGES